MSKVMHVFKLIVLGFVFWTGVTQAQSTAIVGGKIFVGTGDQVIESGTVIVEGDRIVAIGNLDEIDIPTDAKLIDATGKFVMPGIIDIHVHLTIQRHNTPSSISGPGLYDDNAPLEKQLILWRGEDFLTPWLESGVTTVVDVGTIRNSIRATEALALEVAEHAPRMFFSGPIITAPKGYPTTRNGRDVEIYAREVDTHEQARAFVSELIDYQNADLIKVAIERGFTADYEDRGWPTLSTTILTAIVEEASKRNKLVYGHITQIGELKVALNSGINVGAHTPNEKISDELLREALRKEFIFTSTTGVWGVDSINKVVAENLQRYNAMGGTVCIGSDFPYSTNRMPIREFRYLADAGISNADILKMATYNGAKALGLENELGLVSENYTADLIVINGDPLKLLEDLNKVEHVIRNGELIK